MNGVWGLLPDFYRAREHFFVYVLLLYLFYKSGHKQPVNKFIRLFFWVWPLVILLFLGAWIFLPPLNSLIGYWNWVSPFEWALFLYLSYHTLNRNLETPHLSFTVSALATNFCGYLYELPYFIGDWRSGVKPFMWAIFKPNQANIFLVNSQIISGALLLLFYARMLKCSWGWIHFLSLLLIVYYWVLIRYIPFYLARIPSMFFFLILFLTTQKVDRT